MEINKQTKITYRFSDKISFVVTYHNNKYGFLEIKYYSKNKFTPSRILVNKYLLQSLSPNLDYVLGILSASNDYNLLDYFKNLFNKKEISEVLVREWNSNDCFFVLKTNEGIIDLLAISIFEELPFIEITKYYQIIKLKNLVNTMMEDYAKIIEKYVTNEI